MKRLDVVAGVVWQNGRFLASQRHKGSHAGFWEFPGGKIDAGESCLQALTRELREELDISLEEASLWRTVEYPYPDKVVRLHVFQVTRFSGEPRSVEGQPFNWVSVSEAREMRFLQADEPLVAVLREPEAARPEPVAAFDWMPMMPAV